MQSESRQNDVITERRRYTFDHAAPLMEAAMKSENVKAVG